MKANWATMLAQRVLGLFCYVLFVLPYVRAIRGRPRKERRLYVCNHVSLLDTILLGGIFWSRCRLPILVLGDRQTWHKGWFRRFLASRVGYLIERGRTTKAVIQDLRGFADCAEHFNLIVFPEGTRGDGSEVGECQPGIYYVARALNAPIIPVFVENMQAVSTKRGRFRLFGGWRKITVHIGDGFGVGDMKREAFLAEVRERISTVPRQKR